MTLRIACEIATSARGLIAMTIPSGLREGLVGQ
jgi:hypothetical protein